MEQRVANQTYTTTGILEQIVQEIESFCILTKAKFHDTAGKLYDAGVSDEMICFLPANMKAQINEFEDLPI